MGSVMPFLNGSPFFGTLNNYRVLTIDGRYGGGKTALAFRAAYELCTNYGYRYILSNCRSVWTDSPSSVQLRNNAAGKPQYLDAVIILDEGGLFLKLSRDTDDYLAFLRKANVVLILPSVSEVARSLRSLTIQRVFNGQTLGLPAWVYTFLVSKGHIREKTSLVWWRPSEIFGIYDTDASPTDDGGLGDFLVDWKDIVDEREKERQKTDEIRYHGKRATSRSGARSPDVGQAGDLESIRGLLEEISETTGATEREVIISLPRLSDRKRGR
jgi:hypothetical protein